MRANTYWTNLITNYKTSTTPLFGLYIAGSHEGSGKVVLHYRTNENNSEKSITSSSRYDDNKWHHVVGIKDASNNKILLYLYGPRLFIHNKILLFVVWHLWRLR